MTLTSPGGGHVLLSTRVEKQAKEGVATEVPRARGVHPWPSHSLWGHLKMWIPELSP